MNNLLEITRENLSTIQNKFSAAENFKKSSYKQRVNLWEKGDHARLYVPRNAYEQAGYIDLHTGEVYPTRPGNTNTLEEVRDYILAMQPEPEPEAEVVPKGTEPEPKAELTSEAEAIREHVQWFFDNRGNWWEKRYTTMLRKRLVNDGLIDKKVLEISTLSEKDELIAAIDAELRNAGLSEYCSSK